MASGHLERGLSAALTVACCCSCLTYRAGREWKLALGSGSWVGGIEVETFDELCFEKILRLEIFEP